MSARPFRRCEYSENMAILFGSPCSRGGRLLAVTGVPAHLREATPRVRAAVLCDTHQLVREAAGYTFAPVEP